MSGKRRKDSHGEGGHGSSERWLVSYADMITLLVVFFIILYAQSNIDQTKFAQMAISMRQAFGAGTMVDQSGTGLIIGSGGRVGEIEIAQFTYVQNEMEKFVEQQGLTDEVSIGSRKDGFVVEISGNVLFDSGSATLKPQAGPVLDKLASLLEPLPNEIRVEGHTDDVPVDSPEFATNWELSVARAVAVSRYFVEADHLQPERIGASGYGQYRPKESNDTRQGRAKNRRVEVVVFKAPVFEEPGSTPGKPSVGPSITPAGEAKPASSAGGNH